MKRPDCRRYLRLNGRLRGGSDNLLDLGGLDNSDGDMRNFLDLGDFLDLGRLLDRSSSSISLRGSSLNTV